MIQNYAFYCLCCFWLSLNTLVFIRRVVSYLCKNEVERLTAGSLFRQDFCSVRTCDASQVCKAQLSPCTAFKEWLSFHKANSVHHSPIFFNVRCSVTCFKNVLKESDDFLFLKHITPPSSWCWIYVIMYFSGDCLNKWVCRKLDTVVYTVVFQLNYR